MKSRAKASEGSLKFQIAFLWLVFSHFVSFFFFLGGGGIFFPGNDASFPVLCKLSHDGQDVGTWQMRIARLC